MPLEALAPRVFPWRWVSVVAAGAVIFALVWNGFLTRNPRSSQLPAFPAMRQEEVVKVLENEVYDALFSNDDLAAVEFSTRVSTLAYVQAALDGGWPCERRRTSERAVCDQRPFFLRAGDQ
jgi:hypothetical protein